MFKEIYKNTFQYAKTFLKWIVLALVIGVLGGLLGSFFHHVIEYATHLRIKNEWLIYLLPLGGVLIAIVYGFCHKYGKLDTNRIIRGVQGDENIPFILAPLIFFASGITHLFGGSQGREGAALQIGGAMGYHLGKAVKLSSNDMHTVVMTGMSCLFSALFGTPITAAVFAVEVSSVGTMHYGALFPSVIASIISCYVAGVFGVSPVRFSPLALKPITIEFVLGISALAILCALVSILFCTSVEVSEKLAKKHIPNKYLRSFFGGAFIVVLTILLSTYDYNGAGMNIIKRAIDGETRYEAFILKILFTAVSVAAGFKGGEIVPTFFIGSTFGCVVASVLGIDPSVGAAVGFVTLFCGVVNCPIASVFLAIEVFGGYGLPVFAYAVVISYMLSGNYSLYKSQKIVYSKLDEHYIDVNAN